MLRYGVFHLGDTWVVMGGEGEKLGFSDRRGAIDAAGLILSAHRACGERAELLVQDESGRLSTLTEPPYADVTARGERGSVTSSRSRSNSPRTTW
jgi:hypothetical protein